MSDWQPHVTVATVVFDGARYLLVEERDKTTGKPVFNQPAGHLEARETLFQAALRETREETGWEVMLEGVVGVARFARVHSRRCPMRYWTATSSLSTGCVTRKSSQFLLECAARWCWPPLSSIAAAFDTLWT